MISSLFTAISQEKPSRRDQTANVLSIDYGLVSSHKQGKHQTKTVLYASANGTHCWQNERVTRIIQERVDYGSTDGNESPLYDYLFVKIQLRHHE